MHPIFLGMMFGKAGPSEAAGETISFATNTTDFPDATISTDLVLADAGSHSKGVNNDNSAQKFTKATPEFGMVDAKEFTSIGGTASSPTMQHSSSGMITAGDELLFYDGSNAAMTRVLVGGASQSGAGPYTYTLSNLKPAQGSLPNKVFKVRNSQYVFGVDGSSTTNSWVLTSANSGALTTGDIVFADGVDRVLGAVSPSTTGSTQTWGTSSGTDYPAGGVSLSNGNLTVSLVSNAWNCIKASGSLGAGKYYAEFTVTSKTSMGVIIGLVNGNVTCGTAGTYPGDKAGTGGWMDNGTAYAGTGVTGQNMSSFTNGDVIGVAVDVPNGKAWVRKNGTWAHGDPTTGLNPSLSGLTGTMHFSLSLSAAGTIVANFNPTCPTGFIGAGLTAVYTCTMSNVTVPSYVSKFKPLMYLASGGTNEVLCKETSLALTGSTTTSQLVTQQATSLLPYFNSTDLNKTLLLTVGGSTVERDWSGTVTETGSGPYTTTIPLSSATASAATAASIKNKFQTPAPINAAVYKDEPVITLTSSEITLPDNVKHLTMKVQSDFDKSKNHKIYTKEQ